VVVRITHETGDPGSLRIAVKDSGIGIEEEDLPRVFERFRQVDETAARRYQGSGIGLALAKELVQQMGGKIEVESDVGIGSIFTVSFPLGKAHIDDPSAIREDGEAADTGEQSRQAHQAAIALQAEVGLEKKGSSALSAPAGDGRDADDGSDERDLVLVVDDNPDMRAVVREICSSHFRIVEAENGEAALAMVDAEVPALVISDVMMPGMDGNQLLQALRARPETEGIPVMLLTARAGGEHRLEGLEQGAGDYLTKPFDSRELFARAVNLVRLKQGEREVVELNRRLGQANEELERRVLEHRRATERATELGRYLPVPVKELVLDTNRPVDLEKNRRRITLFKVRLSGTEELMDALAPEEAAQMLDSYLTAVVSVAAAHGATVERMSADEVSGFHGAPKSEGPGEDALRSARMAVQMWERIQAACQPWEKMLEGPPPRPSIVLHSGYATVGNFGCEDRLDYAAVGSVVQEGAAILAAMSPGLVACSNATRKLIDGFDHPFPMESLGNLSLRRRSRPLAVYRLAGDGQLSAAMTQARGDGEDANGKTLQTPSGDDGGQDVGILSLRSRKHSSLVQDGVVLAERYEILGSLGAGGMGSVYHAFDMRLQIEVALKLIRTEPGEDTSRRMRRLSKEVRLARRVTHRNVARIFDLGSWEGGEFVSMEYLKGETLSRWMDRECPADFAVCTELLLQLCAGLTAAHSAGVVHRDLKPSNVVIEDGGRLVILDFGIARAVTGVENTRSRTGALVGSPQYMAPEQVRGGEVDQRADLYSLGALAFELVTGRRVFESQSVMGLAFKHIDEDAPDPRTLRPDIPDSLRAVIRRCLAKDPQARFSTASEISELLRAGRGQTTS
jgi:DNA-binding response OmpR family regulator/predicted Ser/Thr protein kinase